MKGTIKKIIEGIQSGFIFDAHTVIQILLQKYSNVYTANSKFATTEKYHSEISKMIDEFVSDGLIERVGKSWSNNIRDKFSKCVCWLKK